MALIQIPISDTSPDFEIQTALDGLTVFLRFTWMERQELWHMSVSDSTKTPILSGIPMVINTDLWTRFKIDSLPKGLLLLYDASGSQQECGRNDLGQRCALIYYEAE